LSSGIVTASGGQRFVPGSSLGVLKVFISLIFYYLLIEYPKPGRPPIFA